MKLTLWQTENLGNLSSGENQERDCQPGASCNLRWQDIAFRIWPEFDRDIPP
jgi:hypothetical protein